MVLMTLLRLHEALAPEILTIMSAARRLATPLGPDKKYSRWRIDPSWGRGSLNRKKRKLKALDSAWTVIEGAVDFLWSSMHLPPDHKQVPSPAAWRVITSAEGKNHPYPLGSLPHLASTTRTVDGLPSSLKSRIAQQKSSRSHLTRNGLTAYCLGG